MLNILKIVSVIFVKSVSYFTHDFSKLFFRKFSILFFHFFQIFHKRVFLGIGYLYFVAVSRRFEVRLPNLWIILEVNLLRLTLDYDIKFPTSISYF